MSAASAENPILQPLNAAQRRAVTSNASTVAILAGPGSGKTHTLTSRVVWLVQQTGYQPSDIVVATFTVKAAREMKERIGKVLGPESEKKIVLGTFHSIARRYLSAYGKHIGLDSKFGIADDGDSRAIIQRICKRHDFNIDPGYARSWISKKKAKGHVAEAPSNKKQQPENPSLNECYREYQEHLERSNLLDYDDLLVRCVELLRAYPACVSNIQAVLIDEYQDTNGIQYDLMKLFGQARQRITIVGDPDQSIYGWRSAEIRNLYRLLRDFPQTDEISLEENYRSSQSILDVSLTVIQQDKKRYQKVLLPVHTKGTRPVLRKLKSSAAEGDWIVSEIKRAVTMFGEMLKYEDVAILLRSASLSRHIESALGKAGLAYRMIGGHKFYERKEIKVLLDYLRVVYQPDNNDSVARVINVPRRGIGDTTVKRLMEEAEEQKMSLWSLLRKHCQGSRKATTKILPKMEQKLNGELIRIVLNLQSHAQQITENSQQTLINLIEKLLSQLDFKQYLESEYPEDHQQRWQNVQEFLSLANDFLRDSANADEELLPEIENVDQAKDDSSTLGRFLANIALASDAQKNDEGAEKRSVITISTIHAAKGLEWPIVFIPAVYAGSIPHSRAEDLDEERRLLYVAMTRAQVLLYLSCPLYGSQGMGSKVELSPFVAPFATTAFAKQGASFHRPVLETAAKILGRHLPSEKAVFNKIPPMFALEDNLFPIDPIDTRDPEGLGDSGGYRSKGPKRQRVNNQGYDTEEEVAEERQWKRDYSTTMEQASSFTMASLPSFVSAATHQNALSAAAAEEEEKKAAAAAAAAAAKKVIKMGTTRRKSDQSSLLGFVTTASASKKPAAPTTGFKGPDMSLARYQLAASRSAARLAASELPKLPAVDPSFGKHKLVSGNALNRPSVIKQEAENNSSKKRYHCFSSSPPRPADDDDAKAIKEEQATLAEPAPVPNRPATCFHRTTVDLVTARGGIQRPVGMGPPLGIDRVRRPFKPLTITRPAKQ